MVRVMKKKFIVLVSLVSLLAARLCMGIVRAEETADEPGNLYARSAVLMDADSGRILFGKGEEEIHPMASTTKIMTCILALEHMDEGQVVSVSDYAVCQPKVRLGVRGKEEYYIRDLLYSLMLESHNDSAVVIAEGIGGSVEEFARMMNEKARELGCMKTHFVTPNGLDASDEEGVHATTAADLARIMKYCIMDSPKREDFLEITRTKSYQFTNLTGERSFSCNNHNAFLDMMEGALSGKTGFTADAGYCYVGALTRDGKTFIVALLACGWPNNKGYKWKDTRTLMEYGLANYEYRDVWEEAPELSILVKNAVADGEEEKSYAKDTIIRAGIEDVPEELQVLLRSDEKVEIKKEFSDVLHAPVRRGQKIGSVTYILDGVTIGSYDIVALEKAGKRDFLWCLRTIARRICC